MLRIGANDRYLLHRILLILVGLELIGLLLLTRRVILSILEDRRMPIKSFRGG